jgi:hypothetical protein
LGTVLLGDVSPWDDLPRHTEPCESSTLESFGVKVVELPQRVPQVASMALKELRRGRLTTLRVRVKFIHQVDKQGRARGTST